MIRPPPAVCASWYGEPSIGATSMRRAVGCCVRVVTGTPAIARGGCAPMPSAASAAGAPRIVPRRKSDTIDAPTASWRGRVRREGDPGSQKPVGSAGAVPAAAKPHSSGQTSLKKS